MSWDIGFDINTGKNYVYLGDDYEKNYTYNVSPMYYKAFDLDEGFRGLDKMTGDEAIGYLEDAIQDMKDYPNRYKEMNPENGWGNYEGALELLEWMLKICEENPNARVRIC